MLRPVTPFLLQSALLAREKQEARKEGTGRTCGEDQFNLGKTAPSYRARAERISASRWGKENWRRWRGERRGRSSAPLVEEVEEEEEGSSSSESESLSSLSLCV